MSDSAWPPVRARARDCRWKPAYVVALLIGLRTDESIGFGVGWAGPADGVASRAVRFGGSAAPAPKGSTMPAGTRASSTRAPLRVRGIALTPARSAGPEVARSHLATWASRPDATRPLPAIETTSGTLVFCSPVTFSMPGHRHPPWVVWLPKSNVHSRPKGSDRMHRRTGRAADPRNGHQRRAVRLGDQ